MATALKAFVLLKFWTKEKNAGWINLNGLASLSGERGRGKEGRGQGAVVLTF